MSAINMKLLYMKLIWNYEYTSVLVKWKRWYEMRYESDINTARRVETNCRAELLNDMAVDSELSDRDSNLLGSSNF